MTRTKPLHLVLLFVLGATLTWVLELALAASGRQVIVPPYTLALALLLIGAIIVVMALPVRKVAKGVEGARVDPFYATRVVIIAKACSLTAALLAGVGVGAGVFLVTRPVVASFSDPLMAFGVAVGAVALLIGGLVAEHMCTIPPSDQDDPDAPTPAR